MELYRCPSDTGYPDPSEAPYVPPAANGIDDAPAAAGGRPCYDVFGNSYRQSQYCYLSDGFAFAIGPWGKALGKLPEVSRLIVAGEPTFFNMIGLDNGQAAPDPVIARGWHRRQMTDNLMFADGSARATLAAGRESLPQDVATSMGIPSAANARLLSRGPGWRFDTWPVPGCKIRGSTGAVLGLGLNNNQWPIAGYTSLN